MLRQKIKTYREAVDYILKIPRFTSKHTMEETRNFLHVLGDPDQGLCIVHVAGTNGKGSVCAYMRSFLEAAGKRVAVFTSPHLVDIRERFLIEGKMPTQEAFLEAFLTVYSHLDWESLEKGEGYHPTFFEYLFFMAMLLFAKADPDVCILETGLGGRLDATNSVAGKELTVITRIGLDHVEYLGHSLEAIAGEKAGIMRKGVPLVYADVVPEASAVFEATAGKLQVSTYPVSKSDYTILKIKNKSIDFLGKYRYHNNIGFTLPTIALYQVENAALAMKAIEVLADLKEGSGAGGCSSRLADLSEAVTEEVLQEGLGRCFWAGRMEEVLPGVYVDGAHNTDGIRAFLETVAQDGCDGPRRILFGVAADKDFEGMLEEIVGSRLFSEINLVHMKSKRAASMETLVHAMGRYPECRCFFYENAGSALSELLSSQNGGRIYIAGSLYLVGEVKELLSGNRRV